MEIFWVCFSYIDSMMDDEKNAVVEHEVSSTQPLELEAEQGNIKFMYSLPFIDDFLYLSHYKTIGEIVKIVCYFVFIHNM